MQMRSLSNQLAETIREATRQAAAAAEAASPSSGGAMKTLLLGFKRQVNSLCSDLDDAIANATSASGARQDRQSSGSPTASSTSMRGSSSHSAQPSEDASSSSSPYETAQLAAEEVGSKASKPRNAPLPPPAPTVDDFVRLSVPPRAPSVDDLLKTANGTTCWQLLAYSSTASASPPISQATAKPRGPPVPPRAPSVDDLVKTANAACTICCALLRLNSLLQRRPAQRCHKWIPSHQMRRRRCPRDRSILMLQAARRRRISRRKQRGAAARRSRGPMRPSNTSRAMCHQAHPLLYNEAS